MTSYITYLKRKPTYSVVEGKVLVTETLFKKRVTRQVPPDSRGRYTLWTDKGQQRLHILENNQLLPATRSNATTPKQLSQRQEAALLRIQAKQAARAALHQERFHSYLSTGHAPLKISLTEASDRYVADRSGNIIDTRLSRQVPTFSNGCGYMLANVNTASGRKSLYLHRLIGFTFLSDSYFEDAEINHKNFRKTDNRADNLQWSTRLTSMRHYNEWKRTGKIQINIETNNSL